MKRLTTALLLVVAVAVVWAVSAGLSGYSLGNPPLGTACYQTMRVVWVIPMWRPNPLTCGPAPAPAAPISPSECVDCGNPVSHP